MEQYQGLVEGLPAITYVAEAGIEGRWHYVSPQIKSVLGFTPAEWMADPTLWYRQIHPDDRGVVREIDEHSRRKGAPFTAIYRLLTRDGRVVWFRDHGAAVPVAEGQTPLLQGVMLDITDRQCNEGLYRMLFDLCPSGILILDASGLIRDANPAVSRSLGYTVEELKGLHVSRLSPAPLAVIEEHIRQILNGAVLRHEVENIRKDGTRCHMELTETRIHVTNGTAGVLVVSNDVTDRRRAEDVLRRFYESVPLMMGIVEVTDDDILHISDNAATASFFGCTAAAMRNQLASTLGAPRSHIDEWLAHYREAIERRQPVHFTYAHERADGTRWLAVTVSFIGTADSGRPCCCYVVEDVTDRRQTEARLNASEKLAVAGRMAARLAHEINNPLAGIRNCFEMLKGAVPAGHPDYRFVGMVDREVARIARIVSRTLELYRPRHEEARRFALQETVLDAIGLLEPKWRGRDVTVMADLPTEPIHVFLPEANLSQVLFNLLDNAIDASAPGNPIVVAAQPAGQEVRLTVTDRGPGIPAAVQARLFEPFWTTKETSGHGNLGLGLPISRQLIEEMGGALELETSEGAGTTFTIVLPCGEK